MSIKEIKFVMRLDPSLHNKVKRVARKEGKSMNKWIIRTLEEAEQPEDFQEKLEDLIRRLEQKGII